MRSAEAYSQDIQKTTMHAGTLVTENHSLCRTMSASPSSHCQKMGSVANLLYALREDPKGSERAFQA